MQSNNNITLTGILNMMKEFEAKFPRNKIPNYVYANKKTIKLMKEYFRPIIKYGNIDFSGLPVYERDIPDNEVRIYDLNGDLMRTVTFGNKV